jgi:hypothetical protein
VCKQLSCNKATRPCTDTRQSVLPQTIGRGCGGDCTECQTHTAGSVYSVQHRSMALNTAGVTAERLAAASDRPALPVTCAHSERVACLKRTNSRTLLAPSIESAACMFHAGLGTTRMMSRVRYRIDRVIAGSGFDHLLPKCSLSLHKFVSSHAASKIDLHRLVLPVHTTSSGLVKHPCLNESVSSHARQVELSACSPFAYIG